MMNHWPYRILWAAAFGLALLSLSRAHADAALRGVVASAALEAGVPVQLAQAIVTVESAWRPAVRGAAGEYGLMQIKCPTARSVGFSGNCGALTDPSVNARYGTRYLRLALDRSSNDWARAASLYNRGIYAAPAVTSYSRLVQRALDGKAPTRNARAAEPVPFQSIFNRLFAGGR